MDKAITTPSWFTVRGWRSLCSNGSSRTTAIRARPKPFKEPVRALKTNCA
ncbi:hypothetical protein BN2364_1216 [Alloalcanivorax xenomutans]|nr:hypothetical protein BN2364_1216 [Alloalcanivorax xenomutans]